MLLFARNIAAEFPSEEHIQHLLATSICQKAFSKEFTDANEQGLFDEAEEICQQFMRNSIDYRLKTKVLYDLCMIYMIYEYGKDNHERAIEMCGLLPEMSYCQESIRLLLASEDEKSCMS